jgi:hypothetical protein
MPPTTATPPSADQPTSAKPSAAGRASSGKDATSQVDRTQLKLAALLLFGAILAGVIAFAVLTDPGTPTKPTGKTAIIPAPNEGTKPSEPGDRGGWEQLVLMGTLLVVLTGIGVFAIRGRGAAGRPARAAWEAAAAEDHDGVVER